MATRTYNIKPFTLVFKGVTGQNSLPNGLPESKSLPKMTKSPTNPDPEEAHAVDTIYQHIESQVHPVSQRDSFVHYAWFISMN